MGFGHFASSSRSHVHVCEYRCPAHPSRNVMNESFMTSQPPLERT
jgi:hypothetical protein